MKFNISRVTHKILDAVHERIFKPGNLNSVLPATRQMSLIVPALVSLVSPPKAPCQTSSSHAPNSPPFFPSNSENVSIRAPFHGTYRTSIFDMVRLWGFQYLRFRCYTDVRGKACVLDIATKGVRSVITYVTMREERKSTYHWVPTAIRENFILTTTLTARRGCS